MVNKQYVRVILVPRADAGDGVSVGGLSVDH